MNVLQRLHIKKQYLKITRNLPGKILFLELQGMVLKNEQS